MTHFLEIIQTKVLRDSAKIVCFSGKHGHISRLSVLFDNTIFHIATALHFGDQVGSQVVKIRATNAVQELVCKLETSRGFQERDREKRTIELRSSAFEITHIYWYSSAHCCLLYFCIANCLPLNVICRNPFNRNYFNRCGSHGRCAVILSVAA